MTGVPAAQLRAMIRLLWPEEITPTAKRQLESLCEQAEAAAPARVAVAVHAFVGGGLQCENCEKHYSHLVHHGPGIGCSFVDGVCSCRSA